MAEPWLIRLFACNREMQPFSFFFCYSLWGAGGGISGRVRALNLTVSLGSGRVRRSRVRAGFGLQFWARADLYSCNIAVCLWRIATEFTLSIQKTNRYIAVPAWWAKVSALSGLLWNLWGLDQYITIWYCGNPNYYLVMCITWHDNPISQSTIVF